MVSSPSQRHDHDPVRILCKLAGVDDLHAYLDVGPRASTKEALVKLERKRRELERALQDPKRVHEAELFLESYGHLRDLLGTPPSSAQQFDADTPDYYAVLQVQPEASYAAIERAWRAHRLHGASADPVAAQAWRVLGDPLNRAHYDRSRRQAQVRRAKADTLDRPAPPMVDAPMAGEPTARAQATFTGPMVHDVRLDDDITLVSLPFTVQGPGRWRASVHTDHPCLRTQPERMISVAPGSHTLAVYLDPNRIQGQRTTCSVVVANADDQFVISFRVRTASSPWYRRVEPVAMLASAVALVALGWFLGMSTTIEATGRTPATQGVISQLPTAATCFSAAYAPLPAHVDVHIDGFGRPTGFSFGGVASPEADACVRTALMHLEFPPTADGQPAFHRYAIPTTPRVP